MDCKVVGLWFPGSLRPGLENKATDALSHIPPTVHLASLSAPTIIDVEIIKTEVSNDPKLQEIIAKLEQDVESVLGFVWQQGTLKYKGRLVLSRSSTLIPTVLHIYHDSVFGAHSWYLRTYKRLIYELY